MVDAIVNSGLVEELIVVIMSALPIVELRGTLPIAINLFDISWYWALCLAIIGNMLPVPLLLLFWDSLAKFFSRTQRGRKLMDWLFRSIRRRGVTINKYGRIGLTLFVAIPLPITGAWTGSIAAFALGLKFKYAFLSILFGVIIAGAIVTCLSLLGWWGAVIAGVGLASLAVLGLWRT